ncbi:MAG TPA: NADH-quinone oxidoreductase subunit H [Candidatus Thermoplasmatota archaeon]|nr:NADH-quinone oxidoreductase subunit H [Candidatus Thermoplasmatota archaeon]
MAVTGAGLAVLQAALALGFSPLLMSIFAKVKARTQGRRGPPWLQPYRDLSKLLRKDEVLPSGATPLFAWAPAASFAAVFAAAMMVPSFAAPAFANVGGLVTVVFLLALARFLTAMAALDSGSSFGGFGASRDMTMSAVVEPALVAAILWVSVVAGSTSAAAVAAPERPVSVLSASASYLLAFAALAVLVLAETGRIPVDNPATHLELTMIHEAMVLEYGGPRLGLIEWARALKQFTLLALTAALVLPFGLPSGFDAPDLALGLGGFVLKVGGLAVFLAALEVSTAKLRLFRLPELFAISLVLAVLAALAAVVARGVP